MVANSIDTRRALSDIGLIQQFVSNLSLPLKLNALLVDFALQAQAMKLILDAIASIQRGKLRTKKKCGSRPIGGSGLDNKPKSPSDRHSGWEDCRGQHLVSVESVSILPTASASSCAERAGRLP